MFTALTSKQLPEYPGDMNIMTIVDLYDALRNKNNHGLHMDPPYTAFDPAHNRKFRKPYKYMVYAINEIPGDNDSSLSTYEMLNKVSRMIYHEPPIQILASEHPAIHIAYHTYIHIFGGPLYKIQKNSADSFAITWQYIMANESAIFNQNYTTMSSDHPYFWNSMVSGQTNILVFKD